uniref:protein-tyrosine-phosphatase n=1 Tax=Panagrellus redivivus TaxID=6233 RepID=A0A7E4VTM4_PANRE
MASLYTAKPMAHGFNHGATAMSASSFSYNAFSLLDLDDQNASFDSSELFSSTLNDDAIRLLNINEDSGISSDLSNDSVCTVTSELSILLQGPLDFSELMPKSSLSPPILADSFDASDPFEPAEDDASTSLELTEVIESDGEPCSSGVCAELDVPKSNHGSPLPYAGNPLAKSWNRKVFRNSPRQSNDNTPVKASPLAIKRRRDFPSKSLMLKRSTSHMFKTDQDAMLKTHQSENDENVCPEKRQNVPVPKLHRTISTLEMGSHYTQLESPDIKTNYHLDGVNRSKTDVGFRRISTKTLANLIIKSDFHEKYVLIDCRYPYEFNGGHIHKAINLFDPKDLIKHFFPICPADDLGFGQKSPIFYCEFSSVRGPNMANELRRFDRKLNVQSWPALNFEEIYVLSEGYQDFFSEGNRVDDLCIPNAYIKMTDPKYSHELANYNFHKRPSVVRASAIRNLQLARANESSES